MAPRHPQLMDPIDDPEEFIRSSIYYYPGLFPTRTEVLDHTLLTNGNGYEWGEDGKIRSVFSHIEPREDYPERYAADIAQEEEDERRGRYSMADYTRRELARLNEIRADYLHRARTYGPVRATEEWPEEYGGRRARMVTSRDLKWTLLGRAPEHVDPRWQAVIDEARELFAPILVEQGELF